MICKFSSQNPTKSSDPAKDAHAECEVPAPMGDSLISSVGCWSPEGFEFVCLAVADEKPVDFT